MSMLKSISIGTCLAAIGAAASAQNLINNPSFEVYPGPGFNIVANWGFFGEAFVDAPGEFVDELGAQNGTASIKMFGGGVGGQYDTGMFQDNIPVAGGREYRLSAFTYTPDGMDQIIELVPGDGQAADNFGHLPLMIVEYFDTGGGQVGRAEVSTFDFGVDVPGMWNFYELTSTAPADANTAKVTLILIQFNDLINASVAEGSMWWDNISFVDTGGGCVADPSADVNSDGLTGQADFELLIDLVTRCTAE